MDIKVIIERDPYAESPRTWDNIGVMHCAHKRYTLGDPGAETPFVDNDWQGKRIRPDVLVWRPIYLYDHSGLALSHTPFSCPWDSGLLGWHYITAGTARENWPSVAHDLGALIKQADECLDAEMEVYNAYVQGECFGYRVLEDGEEVDSCWGFIGATLEDTGILGHIPAEQHDAARKAWETRYETKE